MRAPRPADGREVCGKWGMTRYKARPVKAPQASQARPVLRTRTPLSLRDISPRSGESPRIARSHLRGRSPREKPPLSGEVAAKQAGRVQPVDGGHSKVAGRACPAPTDCRESLCPRGAREGGSPPLRSGRAVARERAVTQSPSESPRPLARPAPFDKGASLVPLRGFGGTPEFRNGAEGAGVKREQ